MRYISVSVLALLVTGCASLSKSAPVTVSPPSVNGGEWAISGSAETGNIYDDVTLYVNGAAAATGRLAPSEHHDVHIAGGYEHHIVLGVCSRTDSDPVAYTCDVSVDGTSVGTLHWSSE